MSISSSLFNSLQTTGKAAAGERASLLAAPNAESSTSFSQMLRDTNKPVLPPPPPPAPTVSAAPKPAAPTSEVRTETQRQEARAATKRSGSGSADPAKAPTIQPIKTMEGRQPPGPTDRVGAEAAPADDVELDPKPGESQDPVEPDKIHALGEPVLLPATLPDPLPAGPQIILALLAKAGIAADGGAVTAGTDAQAGSEDLPTSRTSGTNPRGSSRADTAQAAGRAATAADTATTELAQRDFTAELQDAARALPQALQAVKGAGPARGEGASVEGLLSASASNPGAAPTQAAPDTPTLTLAQPLYEAGFAPELAARVSLLAADGVQEAQLHLNPADMGPVAVQIVVDGQQAQVSFHAEHADTRAVLEQSMPDLAAALRDAGLTLSGGGVFQQTREQSQDAQQRQADGSSSDRRSSRIGGGDDGGPALTRAAPLPRASRGVLDLYA